MFELKPDYEQCKARIDAFWERELIDRPVVQFFLDKPPGERVAPPASSHRTLAERWLDVDYQVERAVASLFSQEFLGDSMPVAWPNLGPGVFAALYGCPLLFGDETSWTVPILHDWQQAAEIELDWHSPALAWLEKMTEALLEAGRGRFIVGMTDWHPGGDALADLRDPEQLAVDLLRRPREVKSMLARLEAAYFRLYDLFYARLSAAGQPCSTWVPLVCDGKYYLPSNDFSIMIGPRMFDEFFLPGIERECRFLDRSLYHLDGPGALRHLDSLLDIAELDAVQFVPGAGQEGYHRWVDVYRRVQAAGKAVEVICYYPEVGQVIQTLDPHGVFLWVKDVPSRDAAETMLRDLERWAARAVRGGRVV